MAPLYSYKAHHWYPQVGNHGRGQDFGVVGLDRPNGSPTTYTFVWGGDLDEVTVMPDTRRTKKANVVKMRKRPPSTLQPRAMRISSLAREARLQKRAPTDHPSTSGSRVTSGPPQQPTRLPSPAHEPRVASPQYVSYQRPAMAESDGAEKYQSLLSLSIRHPYVHSILGQWAHLPVRSPFRELLLPPCGQTAPSTMVADHFTMSRISNSATSSMLCSSPIRRPPVANRRQDVPIASDSATAHQSSIHNVALPLMHRGQQSQDCSGVLHYPQITFDVPAPTQIKQQPIYCSSDILATQEYQFPDVFEENNTVPFNTHDVLVQTADDLTVGRSPTELMIPQNRGCEPAMDITQCCLSQTPHYAALRGLPISSHSSFRLSPSSQGVRADYIDAIAVGSNDHSGVVKNNIPTRTSQQSSYHSYYDASIPYIISHTSPSNSTPPEHYCVTDHYRIPTHAQSCICHDTTIQLTTTNQDMAYVVPQISPLSPGYSLTDVVVNDRNPMSDTMSNTSHCSAQYELEAPTFPEQFYYGYGSTGIGEAGLDATAVSSVMRECVNSPSQFDFSHNTGGVVPRPTAQAESYGFSNVGEGDYHKTLPHYSTWQHELWSALLNQESCMVFPEFMQHGPDLEETRSTTDYSQIVDVASNAAYHIPQPSSEFRWWSVPTNPY